MALVTPDVNDVLVGRWNELNDLCVPCGEPPSASEECARIMAVELLLIMYYEDPSSVEDIDGLRQLWDSMGADTHAERVAAGVAHIWP